MSDYLAIGQPDIRYTYTQLVENERLRFLDQLMDANANFVVFMSVRLRVKNLAFKQGYIDRAELSHSVSKPFRRST